MLRPRHRRFPSGSFMRIGYRLFGPVAKELLKKYGKAAFVAVVSHVAERAGEYVTPPRLPPTPSYDPPSYRSQSKSPAFNRLNKSIRKRLDFTMPRKRSYRPAGVTGDRYGSSRKVRRGVMHLDAGKFSGKIVKAKSNKYLTRGAVLKIEHGGVTSDSECVYVGHYTHPAKQVMVALGKAIVRMINDRFWHLDMASWDQKIASEQILNFQISTAIYYSAAGATTLTNSNFNIDSTTYTWSDWANAIIDEIMSIYAAAGGNVFPVIDSIAANMYQAVAATTTNSYPPVYMKMRDVYIEVLSNSNFRVQNRTTSTTAVGDPEKTNILDVANNPVRGKQYFIKGSLPSISANDAVTGGVNSNCHPSSGSGVITFGASTAGTALIIPFTKPPPASCFRKCTGSRYVTVQPGQMKLSNVTHRESHTINGWAKLFQNVFREGNRGAGITDAEKMEFTPIGRIALFGLEKMCDTGVEEPTIAIGYEVVTTLSALATYKYRHPTIPAVVLPTA